MKKTKTLVLALASLLGYRQGETRDALFNAAKTKLSAEFWKGKTAQAINKPEMANAEDEDLIGAHDKHMALMNDMEDMDESDMPPGPESVTAANEKLAQAETALSNERTAKTDAESKLANEKARADEATTKLANEKTRADQVEAALKSERTAFAGELIANAITAGRIKPADKATWETEFATDFGAAKTKLANAKATVIKTRATTADLGDRNNNDDESLTDEKEKVARVRALVNTRKLDLMAKTPLMNETAAYEQARTEIKRERPALFKDAKKS